MMAGDIEKYLEDEGLELEEEKNAVL